MRVVRATESPGPLIEFVGAIGIAGMFLYLLGQGADVAILGAFMVPLLSLYPPIKALTRVHSQMTQAQAATQRVFELLAIPNTLTDPAQPVPLQRPARKFILTMSASAMAPAWCCATSS